MTVLLVLALLIAVPIAEIAVLIEVGGLVGTVPTIALIVLTALAGTALIRHQGLGVLNEIRAGIEQDRPSLFPLIEGLLLLIAGLLLLTPGFITDCVGFALLVPPLRRVLAEAGQHWLSRKGGTIIRTGTGGRQGGRQGARGTDGPGREIEGRLVDRGTPPREGHARHAQPESGRPDPDSPWSGGPKNGQRES